MALAKFQVGDTVIINKRTPEWLKILLRHNRKRTIIHIFYDSKLQCRHFYLGTNYRGENAGFVDGYPFRSYMLDKPVVGRSIGRPPEKRIYSRKVLGYAKGDI